MTHTYSFLKHLFILLISQALDFFLSYSVTKWKWYEFWRTKMCIDVCVQLNRVFIFWHCFCSVIPSTPDITRVVFENGTLSPKICWNDSEDISKPILRFREARDNQDWVRVKYWFLKYKMICEKNVFWLNSLINSLG